MPSETFTIDDDLLTQAEADTSTEVGGDWDPDAEYNQAPPPLPDGWHLAKLTNRGAKDPSGTLKEFYGPRPWGANVTTYFTQVEASVIDPDGPENNKRANGNITTHNEVTQAGAPRGSSANMYYRAITEQPLPGVGQGGHIAAVVKELRAEPEVWIRTRLEGQDQDKQKDFKERKNAGLLKSGEKAPPSFRGQAQFMENGKLTGVKVVDGVRIVGRPVIQEVKPRSFTPPGR